MLNHPQIISPEDHPKDCVVFVDRAKTVSAFLRAADELVLNGEHRIICWHPPHGENITNKLKSESRGDELNLLYFRAGDLRFHREINIHFDTSRKDYDPKKLLNGLDCNLTQTLEQEDSRQAIGTNLFFLPLNHPERKKLYGFLQGAVEIAGLEAFRAHGVAQDLRGPFSLAAGNVALFLTRQFGLQATLHGLPFYQTPNNSDVRNTLIAEVEPTGMRQRKLEINV